MLHDTKLKHTTQFIFNINTKIIIPEKLKFTIYYNFNIKLKPFTLFIGGTHIFY